jgi:DNA polymerase III sliding clamp (beta) subunit (PCNA family)
MITLQQDLLQSALNAVTRVSAKNSLQSAFTLVQLNVTTEGILHLSCFNGETAARATLNVDCNEDLAVCVDAATLKAVVETLAGQVRLRLEDTALVIEGAATRTSLRIVEEALPVLDQNDLHPLATCTGSTFRNLLRALPFASTDESRVILQVVHLMLEKTKATALAADGYTAGQVTETIEGPQEDVPISLPVSSMRLLSSLIEDRDTVRMGMHGASRLLFQISNADSSKNLMLATVTVDGNFPAAQIQTLIGDARTNAVAILKVQQQSLVQSIRMVNAMGTQSTFLKVVNGAVKIASAETEMGQARNVLEGTTDGQDAQAWLSAIYLKRAAEAIKGELTLRITSHTKPLMVEAGNFASVIMPMLSDGFKDPFPEEEAIAISLPEMAMA